MFMKLYEWNNIDSTLDVISLIKKFEEIKQWEKWDKWDSLKFEDLTEDQKELLKWEPWQRWPMWPAWVFDDLTDTQKKQLQWKQWEPWKQWIPWPKWKDSKVPWPKWYSAYELAKENWFKWSEKQWLASLNWLNWTNWKDWLDWKDWLSAFELAIKNWFKWTLSDWLKSLKWKDWVDWKTTVVTKTWLEKHKHKTWDISWLTELIEDTIWNSLVAWTNITIAYDDNTWETTINSLWWGWASSYEVTQNLHWFIELNWLYFDESDNTYKKAQSNAEATLWAWHVVEVVDANTFKVAKDGVHEINNVLALWEYVLSDTTAWWYTQTLPSGLWEYVLYWMEVISATHVSFYTVPAITVWDISWTLDADDIDDTATTNKFVTAADIINLWNLSWINTGDQNLFSTIVVAWQSNVVADSTWDTLTLVAWTNVTITTDAWTDTITINSTWWGWGLWTVTSVAISGSDWLEVDSWSPVTTNGTIALWVNKTAMLSHLNVEDWAEVNNISDVNATDLTDWSDTTLHTHDWRYYTETEVDTLLLWKANTSHTHIIGDVTWLQTALDWKIDENAAITWATKTKITYDAKGLVTAWADATTADITDSLNKRYVTDADLIDIWNLSWTNTWDQTTIVWITGTTAEFNTALTDWDFATLAWSETLTNKTLTAPKFADLWFIADANDNEILVFDTAASAVNEIKISNAPTWQWPVIWVSWWDTNISLAFYTKGTWEIIIWSTTSSKQWVVRLYEASANWFNYVALQPVTNLAASLVFTLPSAYAWVDGYALTSTTAWVMSWAEVVTPNSSNILINKSIDLASNTITWTKALFDTACSDWNFLYVWDVTTNATHTWEVTGSWVLTIDKTAITWKTLVTAAVWDHIMVSDASDSDNLKKVTVQTIIDLASAWSWLTQPQVMARAFWWC